MAYSKIIIAALVTVLSVLSVTGQTQQPCQSVVAMTNVNATQFVGLWYEEVRAPAKNVSCVQIDVALTSNDTQLTVKSRYSASANGWYMDNANAAIVNVSVVNTNAGFDINANGFNTTYKILSTDYTTNAVLCGYTNLTDLSTSFGVILTRNQTPNYELLASTQTAAAVLLTNFNDNTAVNITQTAQCSTNNSAATTVPVLASVFALFYAISKFVN